MKNKNESRAPRRSRDDHKPAAPERLDREQWIARALAAASRHQERSARDRRD